MSGRIEVVCGSMYSGKSEELIRRMKRCTFAYQPSLSFKPLLDARYHATDIASHEGLSHPAIAIQHPSDIWQHWQGEPVVGIDEAQFFSEEIVSVVQGLAQQGVRVILAGLDLTYQGKPFGSMGALLALADEVLKLSACCTKCGATARHSQRVVVDTAEIVVGSTGVYEARCRDHWEPGEATTDHPIVVPAPQGRLPQILQVRASTHCTRNEAQAALEATHWDVGQAIQRLKK